LVAMEKGKNRFNIQIGYSMYTVGNTRDTDNEAYGSPNVLYTICSPPGITQRWGCADNRVRSVKQVPTYQRLRACCNSNSNVTEKERNYLH
jgi:hypothetical protein